MGLGGEEWGEGRGEVGWRRGVHGAGDEVEFRFGKVEVEAQGVTFVEQEVQGVGE